MHWLLPGVAAAASAAFAAAVLRQYAARHRPYQLAWGIALAMFTLASLALTAGVVAGWTPLSFKLYYLFGAILNVPVVALQFISGIFINPITQLPDWMITLASVFPVKWIAQGYRSVFLPDSMAYQEAAGAWELGRVALVLGAWCVIGLVLCLVTFRWTDRDR